MTAKAVDVQLQTSSTQRGIDMAGSADIRGVQHYTLGIGHPHTSVDVTGGDDASPVVLDEGQTKAGPSGQVVGGGGVADPIPALSAPTATTALQSAINTEEADGGGRLTFDLGQSNDRIVMQSGISVTPSKLSLLGAGQELDFSAMTSGYAMTLLGYVGDINIASSYHQPHEIVGLHIVGPGAAGVGALVTEGATTQVHKYQITFRNMTWRNLDETFRLNRDTWGINWFSCHFRPTLTCSAVLNMAGTRPDGQPMTNAGERMSLFGCTALNGGTFIKQTWGNTDTQLICCSVDQFNCVADVLTGKVVVSGGHYENLKDGDYWFKAWGPNAVISVNNIDMYLPLGATYNRYSPFYSDEACRFGGIDVKQLCTSIGATYNLQTLCHGYGRAVCDGITFLDSSPRPPFSRFMNLFRDVTDTSALNAWTVGGVGASKVAGWMQPFTAGAGLEPLVSQVATGGTSGATMQVVAVRKTSGQWGTGAAGQIRAFSKTGNFSANEAFTVGGVQFGTVSAGGQAPAGFAISFDGTNTNAQTATATIPWDKNKSMLGACVVSRSGCQAVGKNLTCAVEWLDDAGAVIGSAATAFTVSGADAFEYAGRTRFNLVPPPAGTRSARITFTASAATGTGGTILISDIIVNAL